MLKAVMLSFFIMYFDIKLSFVLSSIFMLIVVMLIAVMLNDFKLSAVSFNVAMLVGNMLCR